MRSQLEVQVSKKFPDWESVDRKVIIPYQSGYSPDFWTGANLIEIKGPLDALDQAKLKKVSDYLALQSVVEVKLPDTLNSTQKYLIQKTLNTLQTQLSSIGLQCMVTTKPTFQPLIVCPVVSDNQIDSPVPDKPKTGTIYGLDIVAWCNKYQIKCQPFSIQRLSMLEKL